MDEVSVLLSYGITIVAGRRDGGWVEKGRSSTTLSRGKRGGDKEWWFGLDIEVPDEGGLRNVSPSTNRCSVSWCGHHRHGSAWHTARAYESSQPLAIDSFCIGWFLTSIEHPIAVTRKIAVTSAFENRTGRKYMETVCICNNENRPLIHLSMNKKNKSWTLICVLLN